MVRNRCIRKTLICVLENRNSLLGMMIYDIIISSDIKRK